MQIQIIKLGNGKQRIIHGDFAEVFKLDYTQSLTALKKDIEFALNVYQRNYDKKSIFDFKKKNILVHQGSNHLDIVDDGVGSLKWLSIEDHPIYD